MSNYKIFFCELTTGIILKENGKYWNNKLEDSMYNPEFENLEDALLFKDNLLKNFPYSEVSIKKDEEIQVFRDANWLATYLQEQDAEYKRQKLPFYIRWFKKKLPVKHYGDKVLDLFKYY